MVLEDIIPVCLAEKKPLSMLPITFLYSTLAIFLALWIFPANAAIVAVFLTTIACMPLMLNVIGFEKQKSETNKNYLKDLVFSLFKPTTNGLNQETNRTVLAFFTIMFLGFALSVTFWFVILPKDMLANLFYLQLNTIKEINLGLSGSAVFGSYFTKIISNNFKVLAFSVLFSFIYGAGAVFVIAWNASVIGVAMGDSIRRAISGLATATGITAFTGYSSAISISLLRYLIHGVPEILAYFVGALAGSLISVSIIRRESSPEALKQTMIHVAGLFCIAALLLILAGIIEVTISPLIKAT